MKFLSDILAKAGLTVDGVVTFNNTATGQTPQTNDNSTKLATTAFIKNQSYLTANQTITVSGDATGSGTTSIALTLANSGVTAGTYGNASNIPTITVDAKGRITSISTNAVSIITTLAGLSDVTLTSPTTNQVLQYNGTKWVNGAAPVTYTLPIATASSLGGIKVGSGLSIDSGTGILSVSGGGAASIQTFQTYIATAGQTVFTITGGYTAGLVEVFLNGSYLSPNQYTATNGTTITLNDAAVLSDIIDVILNSPIYAGGTASTTDQLPEGTTNLYFTTARARAAISLTTNGNSGVATYISGVLNIPNYQGLVPAGGATGQLLTKVNGTDYNTQWVNEAPAASYTQTLKHEVKAGEAITKGQAVYVSSADGTNMIVSKASNAGEGTSSKTVGLLETTVSTNGITNVITEGLLAGLNTATANAGDPVWLGTSGDLIFGLINKPIAPAHLVFIGVVTRSNANNGEIFVKVQNGFELEELHNVYTPVSGLTNNDILTWEASTSLWKNKSIPTVLGYTPVTNARTLTINGTAYDLTTNRSWSVGTVTSVAALTIGTTGTDITSTIANSTTTPVITLNIPDASASARGVVTTSAQTFAGAKTFSSTVAVNHTSPYDTTQFSLDVNGGLLVKNVGKTAQFVLINANPASGGNAAFVMHTVGGTSGTSYADIQGYYGASVVGSTVIRLNPLGGNVLVGSLAGSGSRMVVADATGVLSTQSIVTLGDLSGVPTSRTLTINGTTYDLSANRSWTINSMVYPAAGIAVSTGTAWTTSITDNSANWNTAYGWGNHASAGYATTTYVGTAIANLVASAPAALDTLNELAAALGNDAAFSTTVTTALGNRLRIDIGTQGLTSTQQGYGRTNLGLGSLATLSSIGNSYITDLAWSKITGAPAFITSYTETSTLANVTARGASTSTRTTFVEVGVSKAGSDTVAVGPWFRWTNVAEDRQMLAQLNASNGLTYWSYNGSAWVSAFTLTQAGAGTFTSSVTASSIIKSGGTSSQFLKADGSVDSSTYLTGITSTQVTNALGYTPYNSTNPSGYTTNTGTVTSVSGTGTVSGLTLTGTVTSSGNITLGGTLSLTSSQVTTALGYTPLSSFSESDPTYTSERDALLLNKMVHSTQLWSTLADFNRPSGYSAMIQPGSYQNPVGTHGFFHVIARRDAGGGYGALLQAYNGGEIYHGNTTVSTTDITWYRIWNSSNFNPSSYYLASNPNGYITGYTETDTLASVTARGATSNVALNIRTGISLIKSDGSTTGGQLFYDSSINQLYLWNSISTGYFSIYTNSAERFKIAADGTTTNNGYQILHAGNYSSYALSLSGGTMSGGISITGQGSASNTASTTSVNIGVYGGTYAFIELATSNTYGGWIDFSKANGTDYAGRIRYWNSDDRFAFYTAGSTECLTLTSAGILTINKSGTIISHSGMSDAIGYNPSYGTYIGSPVGGTYYIYANGQFNNNGTIVSLLHSGNYSSYNSYANLILTNDGSSRVMYIRGSGNIIQFQDAAANNKWELVGRDGTFYVYKGYGTGSGYIFQVDGSGNTLFYNTVTFNNTVGANITGTATSISGYNNPTTSATANTIVYRDGNGHIFGNYILGAYFNASAGNSENPTIGQVWTQSTGDNYLRKSTPAHFINQLGLITSSSIGSQSVSYASSAGFSNMDYLMSTRDFVDGTLIQTSINYQVTYGDPFILEIKGNSYGNGMPWDIQVQGYIYADTIINIGAYSNGSNITGLRAINYNGNLCFWFPRQGYWHGFTAKAYTAYDGRQINKVTSISNSTQPTTAKQVDFNPAQSLRTDNAPYAANMNQYVRTSDGVTFNSVTTSTRFTAPGMTIGYWDSANNRIEGDSSRPLFITAYSQPIRLGISGDENVRISTYGQLLINATSSGYGSSGYGYNLGVRGNGSQAYISVAINNQTLDTQGLIIGIDTTAGRFHVRDNKPIIFANNDTERVWINTSGALLINTSTHWNNEKLGIQISNGNNWTNIPAMMRLTNYTSGGMTKITFTDSSIIDGWLGMVPTSGYSYFVMGFAGYTEQGLKLYQGGNLVIAGDVTAYSDARVKTNVKTIQNALDKTLALRGVSYNRTDNGDLNTKIGVIAQEVLDIVPEVVNQDTQGMYNVSYGNMAGLFIEAIKELKAENDLQKTEIEELKDLVKQLINR